MGERIGRMETDFFDFLLEPRALESPKKRFYLPNPLHPFFHRIAIFQS
jgi:hypothetical protein